MHASERVAHRLAARNLFRPGRPVRRRDARDVAAYRRRSACVRHRVDERGDDLRTCRQRRDRRCSAHQAAKMARSERCARSVLAFGAALDAFESAVSRQWRVPSSGGERGVSTCIRKPPDPWPGPRKSMHDNNSYRASIRLFGACSPRLELGAGEVTMSLRRHVNTGTVFTSCRRAIRDTVALGLGVRATIRRLPSSVRRGPSFRPTSRRRSKAGGPDRAAQSRRRRRRAPWLPSFGHAARACGASGGSPRRSRLRQRLPAPP